MKVAFTICSNNYLAHAKTVGDSFLKFHPDFKFVIGLVDKFSEELDYTLFANFDMVLVEDLNICGFKELNNKYNITELNTAVKPSYLHYIFQVYNAEKVLYIDPDILVGSRFNEVIEILDTKNIIVTPHICSPVDDEFAPTDYHTLRGGIFNLGFIALSNYEVVKDFINWWHERVIKYGFANFGLSMFYDQLWANYIPCFYDNYSILKHAGYNMANWNLHERILTEIKEGEFNVNDKFPLRFFHFSSYKYDDPSSMCAYLTRYDFTSRPDLISLFNIYHNLLKLNSIDKIKNVSVFYYPSLNKKKHYNRSITNRIILQLKKSLKVLATGNG
jgi:hypothetical protein